MLSARILLDKNVYSIDIFKSHKINTHCHRITLHHNNQHDLNCLADVVYWNTILLSMNRNRYEDDQRDLHRIQTWSLKSEQIPPWHRQRKTTNQSQSEPRLPVLHPPQKSCDHSLLQHGMLMSAHIWNEKACISAIRSYLKSALPSFLLNVL